MSAASHTEPSEVADTSAADSQADVSALVVLVTRLHDEVSAAKDEARQHAATAAMWQERAGTLADRLAAAESKLLALSAPESLPEASTSPQPVGEAPEPFWRRWRTSAPWLLIVIILLLAFAVGQPAWVR